MDAARRSAYLSALGVDEWRLRRPADPIHAVAAVQLAPTLPADGAQGAQEVPSPATRPTATRSADETGAWAALRAEVAACTRCPLHATRTQGVLGVG
ncbi:MAG TPA: hypothetical protein VMB48_00865, partial [Steroidobacteraceae bacterium]|nr:hypothetical protein [Steroidobacteraceae bacterium]